MQHTHKHGWEALCERCEGAFEDDYGRPTCDCREGWSVAFPVDFDGGTFSLNGVEVYVELSGNQLYVLDFETDTQTPVDMDDLLPAPLKVAA